MLGEKFVRFFGRRLDQNIPADDKVPQLHPYTAGGSLGGPIIKDKLFDFIIYQHVHSSDREIGLSRMLVPADFTPAFLTGPEGLSHL